MLLVALICRSFPLGARRRRRSAFHAFQAFAKAIRAYAVTSTRPEAYFSHRQLMHEKGRVRTRARLIVFALAYADFIR